jgi:hypothetical protein
MDFLPAGDQTKPLDGIHYIHVCKKTQKMAPMSEVMVEEMV